MCVLAGRLQRQVDVLDQSSLIPCIQDPCGCVVFKFHRRKTFQTSKGRNVVVNAKNPKIHVDAPCAHAHR